MHDRFVIDCLLFLFLNILCVARPITTDLASWVIFRDKAAPMDIRLERHETKPNLGRKGNRAQKPGMRPHGVCGFDVRTDHLLIIQPARERSQGRTLSHSLCV